MIKYCNINGYQLSEKQIAEIFYNTQLLPTLKKESIESLGKDIAKLSRDYNTPFIKESYLELGENVIKILDARKMNATINGMITLCYYNLNAIFIIPIMINKRKIQRLKDQLYRELLETLKEYPDILGYLMPYMYT